jgi:hypothetical protein
MSWDHRDKIFALGVALQPTPGVFVLPDQNGLIGVSQPNNTAEAISAADPTQTGTIWDAPRVFLGTTGTGGGTIPLRGYGAGAVPASNSWAMGLIMQACGFAEIRRAADQAATPVGGGSTTTAIALANTESTVDDFMVGMPIANPAFGSGFRQYSLIQDYIGATRLAYLAETLGGAPAGTYTLPAGLVYQLGTLTTAPPKLSLSVWRDKKRYDYVDCVITAWSIDVPVGNEGATVFPSLDFTVKGTPLPAVDTTTPPLPQQILNVPVPAAKGGKFYLDRVKLGHTGTKVNIALTAGAPSNQNQDTGQDGQVILSGSRTIDLTLNQMNVSDFDLDSRVNNQVIVPEMSMWGGGVGNRFGLLIPGMFLDPQNPQAANGFVTLAGNAFPAVLDKGITLAVF